MVQAEWSLWEADAGHLRELVEAEGWKLLVE
jgi:hypothetical protein